MADICNCIQKPFDLTKNEFKKIMIIWRCCLKPPALQTILPYDKAISCNWKKKEAGRFFRYHQANLSLVMGKESNLNVNLASTLNNITLSVSIKKDIIVL